MTFNNEIEIQNYIDDMCSAQKDLLEYIEDENDVKNKIENIIFDLLQKKEKEKIADFLHIIANIANNHRRSPNFFTKFENIILLMKEDIKQTFTNLQIYHIFKDNKRLLLFLIKEGILIIEKEIAMELSQPQIVDYFFPEISTFFTGKPFQLNEQKQPNYEYKRNLGENHNYLCGLIRNDSVEEFIAYSNLSHISLNKTTIKPSIFETNHFLINKSPTLIEYSAFFGAIQIFKYLFMNNVELKPSLWLYVIHSNNPELIHFLEDNKIVPEKNNFINCFCESIKCNHNNIARYIQDNYLNEFSLEMARCIVRYFNFEFLSMEIINETSICDYVKNDHCELVKLLMKMPNININKINEYVY